MKRAPGSPHDLRSQIATRIAAIKAGTASVSSFMLGSFSREPTREGPFSATRPVLFSCLQYTTFPGEHYVEARIGSRV